nr:Gag-Pol polyprotein [Tanacetum cinerariifolium]
MNLQYTKTKGLLLSYKDFFIIAVTNSWQWDLHSSGSGNTLHWQWELSPGSGNALCILFPTDLSFILLRKDSAQFKTSLRFVSRQFLNTTVETPMNMSLANKAHFESEKEVIHLILTRIGEEIYSTVDVCQTAQKIWEAIERLQQGPEWSRFVTIVKQQHKLDEVSYHKLFDILKQYQKDVNELRTKRLARNANPLALVAIVQENQDPYYQTSKSQKSYAPSSKPSIPTRSHTTTRYKGKEISKPITPLTESAFKEDNFAYHKEKMLLCKQVEKGVPLQAEQYDWLAETEEEIDEKELEAHYSYMKKIQEVPTADSDTDSKPLEQNDQNHVESDDERVALDNLIANLKLDVDENK